MQIYRREDRVTTIQRGGAGGVTVVITESSDDAAPHWTIDYYPAARNDRAFTEDSHTVAIPDELEDVLAWVKRRWDEHLHAQRAA